VNDRAYSADLLKQAIAASASGEPVELLVKAGKHVRSVTSAYSDGLRYPHLERAEGKRARLDEIYAPRPRNG
jgi:hypothetical protein